MSFDPCKRVFPSVCAALPQPKKEQKQPAQQRQSSQAIGKLSDHHAANYKGNSLAALVLLKKFQILNSSL